MRSNTRIKALNLYAEIGSYALILWISISLIQELFQDGWDISRMEEFWPQIVPWLIVGLVMAVPWWHWKWIVVRAMGYAAFALAGLFIAYAITVSVIVHFPLFPFVLLPLTVHIARSVWLVLDERHKTAVTLSHS